MRELILKTPGTVKGGATDHWRIFDGPSELASMGANEFWRERGGRWYGGTGAQARAWARNGKPDEVAASDALMTALEAQAELIVTRSHSIISDVAGMVPNVPAFLAGQPLAMRRRQRDHSERAPVAVIVDTTISAGVSHETLQKRGAAILAFVRLLSARRAVELYAGVGVGTDSYRGGAAYVMTRIDTAPLDLARAAFMLCHTSATRLLGYGAAKGFNGHWPYGRDALNVVAWREVAAQAFPHCTDIVAVPGLHLFDPLLRDPTAWILARLAEFGEQGDEE